MEEMQLSETEQRYFGDLFTCCDLEKTGKVPIYKASELFRSANLPLDVLKQIAEATGGWRGGCVGRKQFFAALKLIAAYQAGLPLRTDAPAPLPRLGWPVPTSAQTPAGIWEQPQARSVSPDLIQLNDTDPSLTPHQDEAAGHTIEGCGDMGTLGGQRNGHHSAASSSASSSSPSPPPTEPHSLVACGVSPGDMLEGSMSAGIAAGVVAAVPAPNAALARVAASESVRIGARSPEASSTASDSPTPTNSAQERRWAAQQRWHHGALVCEEQRQLLGTEEESSDRHSSDDDAEDEEAAAAAAAQVWSISPEQKEYYEAQFRSLQPDPQGLVAGPVARLFFEKSRLPVHELRRIWQLSDVTKDGALSLPEFNTAMHLVVLRRNNIALPDVLPPTLVPQPLLVTALTSTSLGSSTQAAPSGATITSSGHTTGPVHVAAASASSPGARSSSSSSSSSPGAGTGPPPPSHAPPPGPSASAAAALVLGAEVDADSPPSLSPPADERRSPAHATHRQGKEWTKFVDSPTSSVSSPGPKPVNFDFHKAAVEQDPKILHPVALRLTPEQMQPSSSDVNTAGEEPCRSPRRLAPEVAAAAGAPPPPVPGAACVPYEPLGGGGGGGGGGDASVGTVASPKKTSIDAGVVADIRAIQRPTAKKPAGASGPGILPPPPSAAVPEDTPMPAAPTSASLVRADSQPAPQGSGGSAVMNIAASSGGLRKEPPPPPPPRPLRSHTRSSSLDLNRLGPVVPGTPPVVPPRISPSTTSPRKLLGQRSEGDVLSLVGPPGSVSAHGPQPDGSFPLGGAFADFSLHFATRGGSNTTSGNSGGGMTSNGGGGDHPDSGGGEQQPLRRHGAFEVYRKPSTSTAPSHLEATSLPEDTGAAVLDAPASSAQRGRGATLQRLQEQNWRLARVCAALARELAALAEERAALEARLQQLRGQAPTIPPTVHDDHRSAQWRS